VAKALGLKARDAEGKMKKILPEMGTLGRRGVTPERGPSNPFKRKRHGRNTDRGEKQGGKKGKDACCPTRGEF